MWHCRDLAQKQVTCVPNINLSLKQQPDKEPYNQISDSLESGQETTSHDKVKRNKSQHHFVHIKVGDPPIIPRTIHCNWSDNHQKVYQLRLDIHR